VRVGRPTGVRHGGTKLTAQDVREMRQRYRRGDVSILALAVEYDVSYSTCRQALTGKTWKQVDRPVRMCPHCGGVEP
jgi:hypothetical protein